VQPQSAGNPTFAAYYDAFLKLETLVCAELTTRWEIPDVGHRALF
jgi:hypothetical protein